MRRLFLVWAVCLVACARAPKEEPRSTGHTLLSGGKKEEPPIDVAKAGSDAAELVRAVTHKPISPGSLGAHRVHSTSTLRVLEKGAEVELLTEEASVDVARDGTLHAVYTNSKDQGRELYFEPASPPGSGTGTVWVRPRYGKFHRRAPTTPDEGVAVADEIAGAFAADLDLAQGAAAVADAGEANVAGRPGKRIKITKGAPRALPPHTLAQQGWRDSAVVEALDGEVVLDAATGALLSGKLTARVTFTREKRTFTMELSATHEVAAVGAEVAVAIPADEQSVATPGRTTEWADREDLLKGIAEEGARLPTPEEARGQ